MVGGRRAQKSELKKTLEKHVTNNQQVTNQKQINFKSYCC